MRKNLTCIGSNNSIERIAGSFVMDDFKMVKNLNPENPHMTMPEIYEQLPVLPVRVNAAEDGGELEMWRHGVGQAGYPYAAMPPAVSRALRALAPRRIRIFLQEYLAPMPEPGVYDWAATDRYIGHFSALGAQIVAAICYKPPCLFNDPRDQEQVQPKNPTAWQNLVRVLVRRYSVEQDTVSHWEVLNEPNIGELGGVPYLFPDPADYADYYELTARAVKEAAPETRVGGPVSAGMCAPFLRALLERCQNRDVPLDFVSWHHYDSNPDGHVRHIHTVRRLLAEFGRDDLETLVTEWNRTLLDRVRIPEAARQSCRAAIMAEAILGMLDAGLDHSFYYHIQDRPLNPAVKRRFASEAAVRRTQESWNHCCWRMGLFDTAGNLLPPYFVFRLLARMGSRRVAATAPGTIATLASTDADGALACLLVARRGAGDQVVELHLDGLAAGARILDVRRIDNDCRWNEQTAELIPVEKRETFVDGPFTAQVYLPAGSVALARLLPADVVP